MMAYPTGLEDRILAAFKRALVEGRLDVAEHLLRALETLQPDPIPGSAVADAYSSMDKLARSRRVRRSRSSSQT